MPPRNAHLLVSSHISSAFKQPYFYPIPPSTHREPGSNRTHPSSALRERIKDSTSPTGGNTSAADHALHATINTLPAIGDVLLRITHSGYALEATLLDWHDGQPVVWEFTEKLVPMPAIKVVSRSNEMGERNRLSGDQSAYVYVLLEGGTLYRISFPLHPPFFHDEGWNAKKSRLKEYTLPSNVSRPINGSMIIQKDRSIVVNVNKGALLRLEVEDDGTLKDRLYYPHQQSLLSKVFRTVNPEEDQIISLSSPASIGGSSNLIFTLSRDRYLRVWDRQEGNVFSARLPSGPGLAEKEPEARGSRASSVISGSNTAGGTPQHLLGRERRNYLRCFYMSHTEHTAKNLRILIFIPTPHSPSSGGFFILYRLSDPGSGSKLEALGEKEASDRTARSALKDFVVKLSDRGAEVHCLWEHSGESMYEFAELGIERMPKQPRPEQERHTSGSSDVLMQDSLSEDEEQPPPSDEEEDYDSRFLASDSWQLITPLRPSTSSSIPSADSINFLSSLDLSSPNIVSTILQELFRPGGFSPYTIAEALTAYVEASWVRDEKTSKKADAPNSLKTRTDPLKDQNTALRVALSRSYPTLRERVGAIVGCRFGPDPRTAGIGNPLNGGSNLLKDSINSLADGPDVNIAQEQEYYAALRRDWEGFLARCREIEKAGRWPVGLGIVGMDKDKARTNGGDCVVLERERMGMLVGEDSALGVHRRVMNEIEGTESMGLGSVNARWRHDPLHLLVGTSLALKTTLAPSTWSDVTTEMYEIIRQSIGMTYQDLLLDLGRKVEIEDMSDDLVQWVFDQVELMEDEVTLARALDALGVLVRSSTAADEAAIVKLEEDEEEVGMMLLHPSSSFALPALGRGVSVGPSGVYADHHNQWTKSLTASYLSASLEARYDMSSSVVFLMMLLKSRGHMWMENTGAVVIDELFAGLRSSSLLRQCASRVMEDDKTASPTANGNITKEKPGALKGRATHFRAGTADSVVAHMANMNVSASMRAPAVHFSNSPARVVFAPHMPISLMAFPTLPPTTRGSGSVPLLQSLLPPLRRPFKLPYASDAFLLSNGIIHSDSMLIACADEVRFAEDLRRRGHLSAAADVIDWLPKGNACCYVAGRLRTQRGDYDEAADLFERSGRSFGSLAFRNETEAQALRAVLPKHLEDLDSLAGYYEHIAKLFEEESQYSLATPFYKLAIESAEDPRMTTDLWYNVFRGQLLTDEYEAAYMSLMAMTDPELRRKLVSELVTTMCDRNQVEMLMRFNFVGCANEVEAALGFKARNADPLQRPLYSQIMYSWYIKRGDYRNAASTMYQRARILDQQSTDNIDLRYLLISLQVEAYIVAINALCLLDDRDAWISLPLPEDDQGENYGPDGFGRFGGALPESKFGEANRDSEIVELADMRRECELCSSRRRLIIIKLVIENRINEADFLISPMEVLQRFAELGMFEEALYAARIFQEDMTVIFTQLVGTCIRLSRGEILGEHERGWTMSETIVRWEGGYVQKAWRLLQHSLERHDNAHNGWKYRKVCLERILDADRVKAPPTWLTAFFQDREPEYLIRTCLRYHMILAAIDYTMVMIQKANQMFDKGSTVAATQTHLPYALIDSVVGSATTGEEKRRAALVRGEVNNRVGKVNRWDWS